MKTQHRAFSMVEIMVVLAIVALLSAMTFGVFGSIREGNKRGTCASNLNQIYSAMRQYSQDFDGQAPYDNSNGPISTQTPRGGLGLWSLYTFPPATTDALKDANCNGISDDLPVRRDDPLKDAPLAGYVKAARVLHCPSDNFEQDVSFSNGGGCGTQKVRSSEPVFQAGGVTRLNPRYLSYGNQDDDFAGEPLYATFRASNQKRQLRFYSQSGSVVSTPDRRTPDQTVATWCRFHRGLNPDGTTKTGDNSLDNVLFFDGSVGRVPVSQSVTDTNGTTKICTGSQRVPLAEQNKAPVDVVAACH